MWMILEKFRFIHPPVTLNWLAGTHQVLGT